MDILDYKHTVSVIIPTYNRIKSLLYTINSLINTNNSFFIKEIIIINDKSTEQHYYQLNFKDIDPRIILINNSENTRQKYGYPSAGHNRKLGQKIATGKYIAFCDDDDCFYPNKLLAQLIMFNKYPELVMCTTLPLNSNIVYEHTQELSEFKETQYFYRLINDYDIDTEYKKINDVLERLSNRIPFKFSSSDENLVNNRFTNSAVLYKAELHDKIGYVHALPNGQEDYNWNYRCVKAGKCGIVQQHLLFYDLNHGGNISYNLMQPVNVILDNDYIERYINEYSGFYSSLEINNTVKDTLGGNYVKPVGLAILTGTLNKNINLLRDFIKIYGKYIDNLRANLLSIPFEFPNNCCGLFNPLINLYSISQSIFNNKKKILQIGNDLQSSTMVQLISHQFANIDQYNTEKTQIDKVLIQLLSTVFQNNFKVVISPEIFKQSVSDYGMIHMTMNSNKVFKQDKNIIPLIKEFIGMNINFICIEGETIEDVKHVYNLFKEELNGYKPYLNILPSEKYFQIFLYK